MKKSHPHSAQNNRVTYRKNALLSIIKLTTWVIKQGTQLSLGAPM